MNWVSKTQYLERRIKKLEATLKLLTDHMQVDEDGNIVIEANKFDISTNDDIKIKSYSDITVDADNNLYMEGATGIYRGRYSASFGGPHDMLTCLSVNPDESFNLTTTKNTSIRCENLKINVKNQFTSNKALEVVE